MDDDRPCFARIFYPSLLRRPSPEYCFSVNKKIYPRLFSLERQTAWFIIPCRYLQSVTVGNTEMGMKMLACINHYIDRYSAKSVYREGGAIPCWTKRVFRTFLFGRRSKNWPHRQFHLILSFIFTIYFFVSPPPSTSSSFKLKIKAGKQQGR